MFFLPYSALITTKHTVRYSNLSYLHYHKELIFFFWSILFIPVSLENKIVPGLQNEFHKYLLNE